ncbi:MAG: YraN family protein [Burkholderiaceae bacterium]
MSGLGGEGRTWRQRRGDDGESRALAHLQAAGLALIERNSASRLGEIDLLMTDTDGTWVFVEVRVRRSSAFGGAAASVGRAKQLRVRRQAEALLKRRFGDRRWPPCRFDVCAIEGDELNWIRDAF